MKLIFLVSLALLLSGCDVASYVIKCQTVAARNCN
jgi:hypothetical protein